MNFVKASLKYKQVTISVLVILFALGINSLFNMPRREDPKITIPGGLVIAYYPGADAAMVEDRVTQKLEEYLFRFEEVRKEKTYSVTSNGMVEIHVWLEDKVRNPDIFWNKLKYQMQVVKALDLPEGVMGPLINSDWGDTESLVFSIGSNDAAYSFLDDYARKLEDQLRTIPAVSKLKRIGEQKEQITVHFSSPRLAGYDISITQAIKALKSQNTISPAGEINTGNSTVSLRTTGYFTTVEDVRNQIIGTSKTGAVIRLGDVATIERSYADPVSKITVNGTDAILLAVQMHEGKNIVRTGKEIGKLTENFASKLPSDIKLTTIVNQPEIVGQNISRFLREFLMAIVSVIIVVILLLPFPIAAVAATAIPMTISITFALMQMFGIELHQVSLASLITVLGMVVDDAIVIADNYVELLDRGNDRLTAAWRSATDLVVPVLTATITIIGSFLPLVILTGAIGEFIRALPLTVTIALASSFLVAMFLTPMLCFVFIRKGLHPQGNEAINTHRRTSLLDIMQNSYNTTIDWTRKHSRFTIGAVLATIILAAFLFKYGIRHKFFPEAERNQFTVELWMPSGTRLEKTEEAIGRIEKVIKDDPGLKSYATFTGLSAPRFYYNYSPEMPSTGFAQILINTKSEEATEELHSRLVSIVDSLVPEGRPHVRLMQQGQPLNSPVEIRISGYDIAQLRHISDQVSDILRNKKGSSMIRTDFKEDYYGIKISLNDEAKRLGFTTESVSQLVYTGFAGYPVSTLYEGNNPVSIVLRLNEDERSSSADLSDIWLQSPVTGARVPLRQIAGIEPEWQPGRIIRRNGVRTLSVLSETRNGILPSELLKAIKPQIEKLKLPAGYRITYGGEDANKRETYGYMTIALVISLIVIFLVLIFQFRNIKETALVMLTIPLSLFGAIAGLFITGNDFGFTAFVGLISLSGIVVRNAIILIDHTNELIAKGMDIPNAATEAGKRRLRPIFLTAMAAAIGVLPMIISGSPLWSPLASVIAFGVIWSMIISTLAIPVLYIAVIKPEDKIYLARKIN